MKTASKKIYLILDVILILCFTAGIFLTLQYPFRQDFSLQIFYRDFQPGTTSQIFWADGGSFSEEASDSQILETREVSLSVNAPADTLSSLRLDGSNSETPYSIAMISFLIDDESFLAMRAAELSEAFTPINARIEVSEETDALVIYPATADSGLLLCDAGVLEAAAKEAARICTLKQKSLIAALIILLFFSILCVHQNKRIRKFLHSLFAKDAQGKRNWFMPAFLLILVIGILGVLFIGLFSALGLHPDEWDVKACLDYGMTHFLPPDMRDEAVANTYSGYGYTKLDNNTWYFFLAGKIALVSKVLFYGLAYYRIPNIFLFIFMIFLAVRHLREKNWLMLCLGISAQAWYIFSYTTADALDYFLAFLVILQITDENSLLFRTLFMPKNWKYWLNCLLLGTLFGFVFLGKPYYWSVLGLAFLVLLVRLIESRKDKDAIKQLFGRYAAILGVFIICVGFRYSFDFFHYGLDKSSVELEMDILHADYDKNPTTPEEDWCVSYHMMERGYSIFDFLDENPDWFSMTYKSFCGLIFDNSTGAWYYWAMGILYTFLYLCILWETLFQKTSIWDKGFFIIGSILMAAALGASILNSWMIDSQAQGRYLLPVLLVAGFMASRVPKLSEKWYFRAALLAAGVLTAWYFTFVGIPLFVSRADLPI